jgi:hypothetical protein
MKSYSILLLFLFQFLFSDFILKVSTNKIIDRYNSLKATTIELLNLQYHFKQNVKESRKFTSCSDPSEEKLASMLVGFNNQYQFNGLLGIKQLKNNIYKNFLDNVEIAKRQFLDYENNVCDSRLNLTKLNELAICPYHFKIIDRTDRFPHLRTQAVCNCANCTRNPLSDDAIYKCMPITILMPVLKKDTNVCVDGVYSWKPILEYISIACECKKLDISGLIDIE